MGHSQAYPQRPRTDWVREWPAMVVLAGSAVFWSAEVEKAISGGTVGEYLKQCTRELMDLTDLVRGQLSSQDRLTLGALITIDVHARDVVQELADAGGCSQPQLIVGSIAEACCLSA
jgi:dynein heavy chain, axonemal